MMHVLVVKTSSLGDVIHTLPALTDAAAAIPDIRFDWVVEEAYAEIPHWHPAVDQVLPLALRRWRRDWRKAWQSAEPSDFLRRLRSRSYERVIDAQGLLFKSGLTALLARGPAAGYSRRSARDPWVTLTYRRRHPVSRDLHAVARIRRLFAADLGYTLPQAGPDYGIRRAGLPVGSAGRPHLVFLPATTWPSKQWPPTYWAELTHLAAVRGFRVFFPWHSPEDRLAAERIIRAADTGELLARQGLTGLAGWLGSAAGVVGVDTGLAHLAAALRVPAVTLYGPTRVDLTGAIGSWQLNLAADFPCAPCLRRRCNFHGQADVQPACFASLPPQRVWAALQRQIQIAQQI